MYFVYLYISCIHTIYNCLFIHLLYMYTYTGLPIVLDWVPYISIMRWGFEVWLYSVLQCIIVHYVYYAICVSQYYSHTYIPLYFMTGAICVYYIVYYNIYMYLVCMLYHKCNITILHTYY